MTAILTPLTLVAVAAPAIAQDMWQPHDLYTNRDGKTFTLERSLATLAACDAAAKSLYESKRVLGAGCKPSKPAPTTAGPIVGPNPNPNGEFGQRFIESQHEQRE